VKGKETDAGLSRLGEKIMGKTMTKERTSQMDGRENAIRMFETRNDLGQDTRRNMVDVLNQHLADTFDLMSQTKQAHWNVKGPHFIALHEMFDMIAAGLLAHIDTIAERCTALGGYAMGTARMAAANSSIEEYPTNIIRDMDHVQALADRFATAAQNVREGIDEADEAGDKDTADMFTEISRDLDKWLWFLEAHLQA
jgi:starvation-inducible DNA-binding protein